MEAPMLMLLLLTWGPILLAVGIALTVRLTLLRAVPRLTTRDAVLTVVAGGVPLLVTLVPLPGNYGFGLSLWPDLGTRAAIPLILGIFGVVLLSFGSRSARTHASAQLRPRTVRVFVRPRQPIILAVLAALTLTLTLAAGAGSDIDELGHHTRFTIALGTSGTSGSTEIYGWYYSLPALGLLTLLIAVTTIGWLRIPRPAWSDDIDRDTAVRRNRADNISRIACGAVLLQLAVVFGSLAGTASMMMSTHAESIGTVSLGTPFAAMAPALWVAQTIAVIAGSALWLLTALTGVPIRVGQRVSACVG